MIKKFFLLLIVAVILSCSSIKKPSYIPLSEIDFADRLDDHLQLVIYYNALEVGDGTSYMSAIDIKQSYDYKLFVSTAVLSENLEILNKLNNLKLDKITKTDYFLVKALVEIKDKTRILATYTIAAATKDIIKVNGIYYSHDIKPFFEIVKKFVPIEARRYYFVP